MRSYVFIATHARPKLLERTLLSLAEADRPDGFERVIVIENASESSREVCKQLENDLPVEYRHVPEPGKSRALQSVIEDLGSGFAFYADDDVRVCPGILKTYVDAAKEHGPDVVLGGPVRIDYEGDPPPDWLVEYLPVSAKGWEPDDPAMALRWTMFVGFNYGGYIERFIEAGGFNPDLGPGAMRAGTEYNPMGQDTDMQQKLLRAGCRLHYLPDAVVWHWVPRSRCTPKWALHRAYRKAITDQLDDRRSCETALTGPRWRGAPRWTWKRWLSLAWSSLAASCMTDAHARFFTRLQWHRWRGYQEALRIVDRESNDKRVV